MNIKIIIGATACLLFSFQAHAFNLNDLKDKFKENYEKAKIERASKNNETSQSNFSEVSNHSEANSSVVKGTGKGPFAVDVLGVKIGDTKEQTLLKLEKANLKLHKGIAQNSYEIRKNNEAVQVSFLAPPDKQTVVGIERFVLFEEGAEPRLEDFEKAIFSKYGEPTGVLYGNKYLWNYDDNDKQVSQIGRLDRDDKKTLGKAAYKAKRKVFSKKYSPCAVSANVGATPIMDSFILTSHTYKKDVSSCNYNSINIQTNTKTKSGIEFLRSYGITLSNKGLWGENIFKANALEIKNKKLEAEKQRGSSINL
jgi:hypothetical protein